MTGTTETDIEMKSVGLIGGMSWHASAYYYRLLNEHAEERNGSQHNAASLMETLSFAPLLDAVVRGDERFVTERIVEAACRVQDAGAGCILITAFTAHFAAVAVQEAISIPLIHAGDALAADCVRNGYHSIGLLGTRFTLNAGHIAARIEEAGVDVKLPKPEPAAQVDQMIQRELTAGVLTAREGKVLEDAIQMLADDGADAVALACTELPLLLPRQATVPLIDGVETHVLHALDALDATRHHEIT